MAVSVTDTPHEDGDDPDADQAFARTVDPCTSN
jgi:hypothetical protein